MAQAPAKPDSRRELLLRAGSAVVIAPVVAATDFAGGAAFNALILAACAISAWEWGRLARLNHRVSRVYLSVLACLPVVLLWVIGDVEIALAGVAFSAVVAFVLTGESGREGQRALSGFGSAYISIACLSAIWIRDQTGGFGYFTLLLAIVIATDVFAYFVGRAIGGPKLLPSVSPNKTWSGAIGGLSAALLATAAFMLLYETSLSEIPLWQMLVLAGMLSAASQAGDLFESWLKRRARIKDSGTIIPGHGGLLDRLDGYLAATPVLAIMIAGYSMGFAS